MNTENLLKLATYLFSEDLQAEFDMFSYDDSAELQCNRTDCGTIGCMAGHGPYAGVHKMANEPWPDYVERSFGIKPFSLEFAFLFSSHWVNIDNTPEGGAKRILYLIRHGLPTGFSYCMDAFEAALPIYSKEEL